MLPIIQFLSAIPGVIKLIEMLEKKLKKKEKKKEETKPIRSEP
jgi:hypothetical protein